jgi:hypothetical protein
MFSLACQKIYLCFTHSHVIKESRPRAPQQWQNKLRQTWLRKVHKRASRVETYWLTFLDNGLACGFGYLASVSSLNDKDLVLGKGCTYRARSAIRKKIGTGKRDSRTESFIKVDICRKNASSGSYDKDPYTEKVHDISGG